VRRPGCWLGSGNGNENGMESNGTEQDTWSEMRREEKISLTKSVLFDRGGGRMESAFLYNVTNLYLEGKGNGNGNGRF